MSVLQKIKEMSAAPVSVRQAVPVAQDEPEVKLRRKAGVLAAFGLADKAIADTLFLSVEQITAIKETPEFKESCAKQTGERAQKLIDLEEGWDAIEGLGVAQVMQHLEYSRDPEFALRAALMANKANRRAPSSIGRVIDASNVGNVITLTVNKNYVTNITAENKENRGVVEIEHGPQGEIPRKASDISSPKRLGEILQVTKRQTQQAQITQLAEAVGLSLDELDEIFDDKQ